MAATNLSFWSESTADDAIRRAEEVPTHIVEAVSPPFSIAGITTMLTVSIGIAISGEDGDTADLLVQRAKLATTQSPRSSVNNWRFFNHQKNERAQRQLVIERNMWRALQNGEFSIARQPIVTASTRQFAKAEALLRWTNVELGVISPDEFIGIAERSGLIVEVGDWVLDQACRQAAYWQRERAQPLAICVNVCRRCNYAGQVSVHRWRRTRCANRPLF